MTGPPFISQGPTREAVFSALFALLKKAPGFVTYSRRFVLPTQIPPNLQPALLMREWNEENVYQESLEKRTFKVIVYGYAKTFGDPSTPGEAFNLPTGFQVLNPLMDAVEDAIEPPPGVPEQTLDDANGQPQVAHVRFDVIRKESGDTDPNGQGWFFFILDILVP